MNRVMSRKMEKLLKVLSSLPTECLLLLIHAINIELECRGKKNER